MAPTLSMTPADLIPYTRDLIRTRQYTPLGRANKIAIGPSADYTPPENEPIIAKFGRIMDLRNQFLPIAESLDRTMLIVPGLMKRRDGSIGLPDIPDPSWKTAEWTEEEQTGQVKRDPAKDQAQMIPQRLEDRAENPNGRIGVLERTNFLVFQPVLRIAYQPEVNGELLPEMWHLECLFDPSVQRHMALLVDPATGETIFFGGRYEIERHSVE